MSEHAFLRCHVQGSVRRPSDRDINLRPHVQGKSPHMQIEEQCSNQDKVTCRFSSCNPSCTKYTCHNGHSEFRKII